MVVVEVAATGLVPQLYGSACHQPAVAVGDDGGWVVARVAVEAGVEAFARVVARVVTRVVARVVARVVLEKVDGDVVGCEVLWVVEALVARVFEVVVVGVGVEVEGRF